MRLLDKTKELCKAHGITVPQLEKDLGFGNRAIYKWNDISPSIDKIKAVADYFDVTVDYLIGNDGSDDEWTAYRQQLMESPNTRLLLDTVKDVSPETLLQIAKIAETLKNG